MTEVFFHCVWSPDHRCYLLTTRANGREQVLSLQRPALERIVRQLQGAPDRVRIAEFTMTVDRAGRLRMAEYLELLLSYDAEDKV